MVSLPKTFGDIYVVIFSGVRARSHTIFKVAFLTIKVMWCQTVLQMVCRRLVWKISKYNFGISQDRITEMTKKK